MNTPLLSRYFLSSSARCTAGLDGTRKCFDSDWSDKQISKADVGPVPAPKEGISVN